MILQRLYELAVRENLLDDLAFEDLPVPYLVTFNADGQYLGFSDIRGESIVESNKKGGSPKTVKDKGRVLKVPRAHGNTANQGFARYFTDTLPRVLPLIVEGKDQAKSDASRATFWEQVSRAAGECDAPTAQALKRFGDRILEFTDQIRTDVKLLDPAMTDRVTFAYAPNGGRTILEEEVIRKWYSAFYSSVVAAKQSDSTIGVCQVTGQLGPIPKSHPTKLQGVPGGMSVGVSLISFDKPAFGHYGFDGAVTAGIGYEATDGYLRSLDALLKNALPTVKERGGKSKLVLGSTAFLYWTKEPRDTSFVMYLEEPMQALIKSLQNKKNELDAFDAEPFYMLALSGNSARAIVRGYLETTLGQAKANVDKWFHDLRIADTSKDYSGTVNEKFPLWQLALATAFESAAVAPETGERLLNAAISGGPVPESLLALCLKRLMAEGSDAFRASRMALIKLILIRKGVPVEEKLDPDEKHPAYVYGRLLAVFEQIQYAALGDVNANVVDKFYGTMSSAPGMLYGRLCENALNHLRKLRNDGSEKKKKQAKYFDRYLSELRGLVTAKPPALHHSVEEQARFALGFYFEKAKRLERIAQANRKKEAKAKLTNSPITGE